MTLPTADPSQIIYMGLRDVDPFEKQMITKHNIEAYEMDKLDKLSTDMVEQFKSITGVKVQN